MKLKEMLSTIISNASSRGTFATPDLIKQAKSTGVNALALAREEERDLYLAFLNGEAEGAIIMDEKGELFGDKAVMLIRGTEQFALYETEKEIIDAVVMGCRIFDKSHLRTTSAYEIPEFGIRSSGMGNLTLLVHQKNEAQNGIRVSIRKDGKIVGSDITTQDGSVGFRVMHGNYDIILQDRNQMITTRRIQFTDQNQKIILEL